MIRGLVSFLFLTGCVNAPVAPNLKIPDAQETQNLIGGSCPQMDLQPVPQKVHLDIQGDKIVYDAGGERILRGYVACRAVLR